MPRFIDLDKLTAFRVDYQNFRAGKATGAKGEIAASTAAGSGTASADASSSSILLPPPLDIIPASVSKEKLAEYRVSYQKFRAGEASGAKGEVSTVVAIADYAAAADATAALALRGAEGSAGPLQRALLAERAADAESCSSAGLSASGDSKSGPVPPYNAFSAKNTTFSVKNTFVHIDDPNQEDTEEVAEVKLPPSLDIIPESVSPERLQAYREDYQKFRAGCASGAKGEVSTLSALDLSAQS